MLLPPDGYKISTYYRLNKKTVIGKKGLCRYCGNEDGLVHFRNNAHSLPELIGNKFLFSLDECDDCNAFFDKHLENNLANFLGVARTTTKIKGKSGVPRFKSERGERIEAIDDALMIIEYQGSKLIEINEHQKTLSVTTSKSTYTPIQAYKCFIKMALAVLPEHELKSYKQCFEWIRGNKKPQKFSKDAIKINRTFVPGRPINNDVWIALFKRVEDKKIIQI